MAPASAIKTLVGLSTGQLLMLPGGAIPTPPDPREPGEAAEGQAFTALFIAGAKGGDPEINLEEICRLTWFSCRLIAWKRDPARMLKRANRGHDGGPIGLRFEENAVLFSP